MLLILKRQVSFGYIFCAVCHVRVVLNEWGPLQAHILLTRFMWLAAEIVPYACKIAVAAAMPKIANVARIHYMGEKCQTFLILHRKTLNATHSNVSKKNIQKTLSTCQAAGT